MQKGRVVLHGDFNPRVGRSTDDDVIGMLGEETCNASGTLISFLNEVELVIYIGYTMPTRRFSGHSAQHE